MSVLLPAVAPVGLIILIGFIVGRTLPLERQTLSQLTLYVLSSALIVDSLYRTNLSLKSTSGLLVGFGFTSFLLYSFGWVISKLTKLSPEFQKGLIATSIFPNNGNMGLPVADFALGAAGLERAVVYMIGSSILMFCGGPAILQGKGIAYGLRLIFKLPLLWSILAGLGLRLLSIKLPFELDTGIQKLGEAAIPVALILLGMQLSDTAFVLGLREILAAIVRLVVSPFVAYIVGLSLSLQTLDLQILVLQSAMPAAVNSFILVSEFGGDKVFVARTILTSTLMSFITLPLIIWLLSFM
jgi:hypothetical protein